MISGVAESRACTLDPATCLSRAELSRFHSLNTRARIDFLAGRVALKDALRRALGQQDVDPRRICIGNDRDGRPYLKHHPQLHCSLAHSSGWGVGAVALEPVGVDIERVRPRSRELLAHISNAAEIDLIAHASPSDPDVLVTIWTLKEAVLKGIGVGFQIPASDVQICAYDNPNFTIEVQSGNIHSRWNVQIMKIEDMVVSVALKGQHEEPLRVNWY